MIEPGTLWCHTVPYIPSVQDAFKSLRWEVFHTRQYRGPRDARSIYALRQTVGAEGTHSILDMQWLGDRPAREVIAPMSPGDRRYAFGEHAPSLDSFAIVVSAGTLPFRPNGYGTWLHLYDDDGNAEWTVFYGRSGGGL